MSPFNATRLRCFQVASRAAAGLSLCALLTPSLVVAQSTTTYRYDALGQITRAGHGSIVTTYTYDPAQNRTSVTTGMNMDPGVAPSGPPASIILLPLPSSALLPLAAAPSAMMARQAASPNTMAEAEARVRAVSLYGVRSEQASFPTLKDASTDTGASEIAVLAKRIAIAAAGSGSRDLPLTKPTTPAAGAPDIRSRATSLASTNAIVANSAALSNSEPPPPLTLKIDEFMQRVAGLSAR